MYAFLFFFGFLVNVLDHENLDKKMKTSFITDFSCLFESLKFSNNFDALVQPIALQLETSNSYQQCYFCGCKY